MPAQPPKPAAHTLILGVGSPLMGDDAVGVLAVQALQARADLPPGVDVLDGGTDGLGLVPVIEGYPRVIVVDAIQMGLPPGTIRRFTWTQARLATGAGELSLHQSTLAEALALAEALGSLPGEIVFYGVQPDVIEWDAPLSLSVERALPELIQALMDEVRSDE